jgi:hypothetical protein
MIRHARWYRAFIDFIMVPTSHMRSVVDRNVVMRRAHTHTHVCVSYKQLFISLHCVLKQITELHYCVTACKDLRLDRISHAPIMFTVHNFHFITQPNRLMSFYLCQCNILCTGGDKYVIRTLLWIGTNSFLGLY